MALSRKRKILFILLAVPLLLIAGSLVTLKLVFTPARLKAMAIQKLEETTRRKVTIADASLSFWPRIGVEIDSVRVSNRAGEGFSAVPFLSVDALRLDADLFPLLRGDVKITSLTMTRPRILLEVNSGNLTNYSNLTGAVEKQTAPESGGNTSAASGAFLISDLRVIDGTIEYLNSPDNSATRARGFSWTAAIEGLSGKIHLSGKAAIDSLSSGTLTNPMISGLHLTFNHELTYDITADIVAFEKGDLTVQAMSFVLSGTIAHLKKDAELQLALVSNHLEIPDLLSLVPKEYAKKTQGVRGTGTAAVRFAVTGTLTDSTSAEITGSIRADGATLQYPGLPEAISNVILLASFSRTRVQQEFRIERFSATLGENPFSASMTVVNFADPSVTLSANGTINLANIGQWYPLETGTTLDGTITGDVRVAGKPASPASAKASGTIALRNVTIASTASKNPVRDLQGTIAFSNTAIGSERLSMKIGKSDMTLGFRLVNYLTLMLGDRAAPRPAATVTIRSDRLFTDDVMAGSPAGPANAPGQPAGSPGDRKPPLPLPGVDMDVTASIGTFTMNKFVLSNVRGTMRISDGVITMNNLSFGAFGGSIISRGALDLKSPGRPAFDLGLDINAIQANAMLPYFTSFGNRLTGKMSMTTALKGVLNDTLGLLPGSLDGSGNVAIHDGALRGFKVNESLASALKLPDLDTVNFHDWTNAFTIKNGRVIVKNLKINALNAEYTVNGSQGFDGTMDYALTLLLPEATSSRISVAGFAGEAVNLFKEPGGRLKLDFNVGGTTDDPKIQLDTAPARLRAEELAKQKLRDEGKKLQDQLKDKAGDALKNLFKKKK
jgi:uncharacterized protein involved in outer membrane biogenesis